MTQFKGFPLGKDSLTSIPSRFFSDLLPLVDNLAELKILLFCFWALPQRAADFPYLTRHDFLNHDALMTGLSVINPLEDVEVILDDGLESAVKRGALLQVHIQRPDLSPFTLYFANTERGRAGAEQIRLGHWRPNTAEHPVQLLPERPNIYKLYEANIGPLTPIIAEELKDAEAEFSAEWVEEAMRIAVTGNKRNWRYIRAILMSWKKDGKDHESGRRTEETWEKFVSGEYGDYFER
jgi:DNA replication protein